MPVFPTRSSDRMQLATDLVNGMRTNPELFSGCPVSADQLEQLTERVKGADFRKKEAKAAGVGATAEKRQAEKERDTSMKQVLRHVENVTHNDAGSLQSVGWGARRPRGRRSAGVVPGQVLVLEIVEEGRDWVSLRWKAPADGGRVASYTVQRKQGDGDWGFAGTSTSRLVRLEGQPQGVPLEYQVVAGNAAGEGPPSNEVRVVMG